MSYILEALKKAQAERQLGATPTIHAPVLHGGEEEENNGRRRWLIIGAVLAIVALGAAGWFWRSATHTPAPVAVVQASSPPAAAALPATAVPQLAAAAPALPAAAAQPSAPVPPAVAGAPAAPVAAAVPAARSTPVALPAPAATVVAPAASRTVAPVDTVSAPVPAVPAASPAPTLSASPVATPPAALTDDNLPLLRGLPDAVQHQIPAVAIGGYIYSRNPEDRLLLVDKVLRHEGEEVAPGLVLEHLLPKGAVFNFRGTRYRAPY